MDAGVILIIIQLIFLEGILSLDNAAVLGAMVAPLPDDKPVPWPRALRGIGRVLDKSLGMQRDAALKVGLLGAYLGRALMLVLATIVIQNSWLRLIGALYLLYLAIEYLGHLGEAEGDAEEMLHQEAESTSFWGVVFRVELADLAFSLDNVVAAVALSDEYWVVLLGVAIGIVLMRFAASIFSRMIAWEPNLEIAAYLLILAISVELLLDDLFHIHFQTFYVGGLPINAEVQQFGITLMILVLTILLSRVSWLRPINVIWTPLLKIAALLLYPIRWLTWPFRALFGLFTSRRQQPTPTND
ncbi:MAG TPA: tellurium resistance protein TerC [Herpetosiphonaceae bacterium]